jgi:hypothetical protein
MYIYSQRNERQGLLYCLNTALSALLCLISDGFGRNDSSIDSLVERELYNEGGEASPKLSKAHVTSPTNLSRDSGLTLSDTQLYDEDSCEHAHRCVACLCRLSRSLVLNHDFIHHCVGVVVVVIVIVVVVVIIIIVVVVIIIINNNSTCTLSFI